MIGKHTNKNERMKTPKRDYKQTTSLNELSRQELAELLYTLITESIQVYEKLDHQISELECLDETIDINAYLKALPRQIRTLRKKLKRIDQNDH